MTQREIESLGVAIEELLNGGLIEGAIKVAQTMQGKKTQEQNDEKEAGDDKKL
jgi:hypothetical protein